jgi:hypothetical protein
MKRLILLSLLLACTDAAAAPCVGQAGSNLRLALADAVRRTLITLDDDIGRVYAAYGVGESAYGGTLLGGFGLSGHSVCVPGGAEPDPLQTELWGVEAHTRIAGAWGARVLVLDTLNTASIDDPADLEGPPLTQFKYRHVGLGVFLTYDTTLELGAIRLMQRQATVPGDTDGWLVSAAAFGVRTTVLLGDDDLESVGVGFGGIPVGPLVLGAGLRHLDGEGVQTAFVQLHDWRLAGEALGMFLSGDVEVELNTARLRSASTTLRFSMDLVAPNPPGAGTEVRPAPSIRVLFSAPFMLSTYAGSRLKDTDTAVVMGGGLGWEMGLYGRRAGFLLGGYAWVNDPVAMDYATNPDQDTTVFTFMARLRLELGALQAMAHAMRPPQMAR